MEIIERLVDNLDELITIFQIKKEDNIVIKNRRLLLKPLRTKTEKKEEKKKRKKTLKTKIRTRK